MARSDVNNLPQVNSIFARVVVKFPRRHDSQHFILQDITGSKMEAISIRNNVPRWDLIIVGIWTDLLQRNALRWSLARVDNNIIIGTMLHLNHKHGCLETLDYSTVHFNPDHHTTYHLKIIRRSLIQNPRSRIVDRLLENKRAHLATVISD
ncbi:hypothetical protein Zm00014a_044289 [Zea mays]|uniref:Uncharacterized protein n=1 Tax=Zea mays TaxID=4577 RepID=A0A3L6DCC5_MAIZE|nr:hypothetical protein Zm00014a_044289 [Zea mays]